MAACGNATAENSKTEEPLIGGDPATWGPVEDTQTAEGENVQIPNPFITCDTLVQAAELAGKNLKPAS